MVENISYSQTPVDCLNKYYLNIFCIARKGYITIQLYIYTLYYITPVQHVGAELISHKGVVLPLYEKDRISHVQRAVQIRCIFGKLKLSFLVQVTGQAQGRSFEAVANFSNSLSFRGPIRGDDQSIGAKMTFSPIESDLDLIVH